MDGLKGLETVFLEEFPQAKIQRCQVHVARNVLAKVPQKLKQVVAEDQRSIFYAKEKAAALELFQTFKNRWEKDCPSAVKCLGTSLEACLTYLDFPKEEWLSLRTTPRRSHMNAEGTSEPRESEASD